jgi:hypothetical protein
VESAHLGLVKLPANPEYKAIARARWQWSKLKSHTQPRFTFLSVYMRMCVCVAYAFIHLSGQITIIHYIGMIPRTNPDSSEVTVSLSLYLCIYVYSI